MGHHMTKLEKQETSQSILYMCRITFRTMTIVLAITYGILYMFLNVRSADAATLKSETVISGDVVMVSDLFDDVPSKQDAIIGNAPAPGQTVILNAKSLERLANTYDIKWKPMGPSDQIVVRSVVQTVPTSDILEVIRKDLMARGISNKFEVTLNTVAPTISLPGNVQATVEVSQMNYTPGRDVFTAVLAAPNAQNPVKTLSVSGLIEKTIQVPVLTKGFNADDIISASDLEWIDIPTRHMVNDTIVDADKLIGKTPVRMVEAGIPIRDRDVKSPQLVTRGDEVVLQFNQSGLYLTAKGKAMQNGAEGEIIRVMNLSSNQSLRAQVTGDKIVVVQ